jgi:RNA polymerase sigma factor (sigma-70 family)
MRTPADTDPCDPARLAELVRTGDGAALDRMTRCYGDRLLRAGQKHCRTTEEAEDAVQDTFLIATTKLGEFRGEGSLEGWLVRIVASACRRIGRGQKNDPNRHDPDVEPADDGDSPEALAARSEVGDRLEAALLGLSPEDRLILLWAEVEGRSGEEIANEIGMSHGAVRTRLTRLRARLKAELAPLVNDLSPRP